MYRLMLPFCLALVAGLAAVVSPRSASPSPSATADVAAGQTGAETYYQDGAMLLEAGDAGGAVEAFTQALALDPAYLPALYGRGLARTSLDDYVRIRAVTPLGGFTVRLAFSDGSEKVVDLAPYLHGPIFEPLVADLALFRAVQVDPRLGTIVWPNGADIDPDVLYHGQQPAAWETEPSPRGTTS